MIISLSNVQECSSPFSRSCVFQLSSHGGGERHEYAYFVCCSSERDRRLVNSPLGRRPKYLLSGPLNWAHV